MKFIHYICLWGVLLVVAGCTDKEVSRQDDTSVSSGIIDGYIGRWNRYNQAGEFDSVVITAVPLLQEALEAGDTLAVSWVGMQIAQAYLSMQQLDSVSVYIERLAPLIEHSAVSRVKPTYYSMLGYYTMVTDLDYEKAIRMFLEALAWAEREGRVTSQIIYCCNTVGLFYLIGDRSGREYAEKAYALSSELGKDSYHHCIAQIMMGLMCILDGDLDRSAAFLDSARTTAVAQRYYSEVYDIDMYCGDIFRMRGDIDSAAVYYKKVVENEDRTYPSSVIRSCLLLGRCCQEAGRDEEALGYFEKGLAVSYRTGLLEFRMDLLQALCSWYHERDDKETALQYYVMGMDFGDSIKNTASEQKFYALMQEYRELEHENEMNLSTIALQKSRHRTDLLLIAVIVVSGLSVVFYVQRKHQKRMYLQLVDKHQKYLEYFNSRSTVPESGKSSGSDADRELFARIETLMREKEVFKQNGITRDSLAEMLGTNRTYVSQAINAFSGKTFVNYINTYRINEAVRMISDPASQVNAKEMAQELGYASVKVFYQVFQRETGLPLSRYRQELGVLASKAAPVE